LDFFIDSGRYLLPALAAFVLGYCLKSLIISQSKKARTPPQAYLINCVNADSIALNRGETSVGRSKSCDIIVNYDSVSRSHAVIARKKKGWVVFDTLSSGGTFVNAQRVEGSAPLADGDTLTFGSASFIFRTAESIQGGRSDEEDYTG